MARIDSFEDTCRAIGGKPFTVKPADDDDLASFICAKSGADDLKKEFHFEITEDGEFRDNCDVDGMPNTESPPIEEEA